MTALRNAAPSAATTQKQTESRPKHKEGRACTDGARTSPPLSSFPPDRNTTLPPWKMLLKLYFLLSPRKSPLVPKCHVLLKENQPNLWKSKASKEGRGHRPKASPTQWPERAAPRPLLTVLSSGGLCALGCASPARQSPSHLKLCIFKDENVGCYSLIMSTAITHILLRRNNWLGAGSGPWWVGE